GLDWFQVILFSLFFAATGLSITLGYHRLFSHLTFKARWPVRLFTLLFGAAAFEGSALIWTSDHRRHHKHVDQEDDPYDISQGFWHAHIGWILFKLKPEPPYDNVNDLRQDPFVRWQDRHVFKIAVLVGFILPALIGWAWYQTWQGALGSLLLAGVMRVVCVQHMTFCINSLCHTIGTRPYSGKCSARDSGVMALFTFGEGYHNFHHEFQHDYRNGVKAWQFDPTKWAIWLLAKMKMVGQLRIVPLEKILLAEIAEKERQFTLHLNSSALPLPEPSHTRWEIAQERLHQAAKNWEQKKNEYSRAAEKKMAASREKIAELKHEFDLAAAHLREAIQHWKETHRIVSAQFA
ncbi:MAG: fatty acid desaturase, partial [Verrucomicrobiota bacterium]|nr:fatty acid desaturase [Verrucomicrobiota bacterium]